MMTPIIGEAFNEMGNTIRVSNSARHFISPYVQRLASLQRGLLYVSSIWMLRDYIPFIVI